MHIETPAERDIFFYGDVDQLSIGELTKAIIDIESHDSRLAYTSKMYGFIYEPQPMRIFINSFGGDAYACLGLISIMKNCTTPIHTYVTGCAMSAGFIIAVNGHERYCYENSTYMFHQMSYGSGGTLESHEDDIRESRRLQQVLDENVSTVTGLSNKKLQKLYKRKKDQYLPAAKVLKYGCVDAIL